MIKRSNHLGAASKSDFQKRRRSSRVMRRPNMTVFDGARLGSGASTDFLGADCGGCAGCARAGCAFARSCPAAAHGSICPAARFGSLGAKGDSQGHRRPRWVGGIGYIPAARAR